MSIIRSISRWLPADRIRRIGRWQFDYPRLAPLIRWGAKRIRSGETIIQYGVGKGLKFDATGGMPGYALGTSEPEEQLALAAHLKSGDTFYDIGANVGFYSTIAARHVGPSGRVYAFEPFPASAAAARLNAHRNGFSNVEVFEFAISKAQGKQRLAIEADPGLHRLSSDSEAPSSNSLEVHTFAIDELLDSERIAPPHVVMIDVEGRELDVLAGMSKTISIQRPIIFCEVHWLGNLFAEFCDQLSVQKNYRVTQLDGSPLPSEPVRFHALMIPIETSPL